MDKQVTIWIDEDLLKRIRTYAKDKTGSSKALSGTINKIIDEYLSKEQKEDPLSHSDSTHTHKTHEKKSGVEDVMEFIKKYYPDAITRAGIEDAIRQTKGMDQRTISKYKPVVLQSLLSGGYSRHPENPLLFLKV